MTKHYILSNFLKASKTFDVYKEVFSKLNIQHSYQPIEIPNQNKSSFPAREVEKFIEAFKKDPEAKSIVVSNPYKQIVPKYCDALKGQATAMNTVNLIVKSNDKIIGENIDGEAFLLGQKNVKLLEFKGKTILILGCGGVSTAVSFMISNHSPKKIILFDIDKEKIKKLKMKLNSSFSNLDVRTMSSESEITHMKPDIIYNGTGIGKISNNPKTVSQTPITNIPNNCICIDANYTPWETMFLKLAREQQCEVFNGFSHMIAFTTLHLNNVTEETITFDFVYDIGKSVINSG